MAWSTTQPPKRKQRPVTIRFIDRVHKNARPQQGQFVWSDMESAFLQVTRGMDPDGGVGLYPEDFTILGWKRH